MSCAMPIYSCIFSGIVTHFHLCINNHQCKYLNRSWFFVYKSWPLQLKFSLDDFVSMNSSKTFWKTAECWILLNYFELVIFIKIMYSNFLPMENGDNARLFSLKFHHTNAYHHHITMTSWARWRHQPHDCLLNRLYSGTDKRKHQRSASLAFVRGIHRWSGNSPHKGPGTRKIFPFDDAIMSPWPDIITNNTIARQIPRDLAIQNTRTVTQYGSEMHDDECECEPLISLEIPTRRTIEKCTSQYGKIYSSMCARKRFICSGT